MRKKICINFLFRNKKKIWGLEKERWWVRTPWIPQIRHCIHFLNSLSTNLGDFTKYLHKLLVLLLFQGGPVSIELSNRPLQHRNSQRIRNRWHLLITLHNNPSLQEHRRSDMFVQKSPFAAFQVMAQRGMIQLDQELQNESPSYEIKLWLYNLLGGGYARRLMAAGGILISLYPRRKWWHDVFSSTELLSPL